MQLQQDSHEIARSCVNDLRDIIGGAVCSFAVRNASGESRYSRCVGTGGFDDRVMIWDGAPMPTGAIHEPTERDWCLRNPKLIHRNRFALMSEDIDREWAQRQPVHQAFYAPNGIEDQLRAMFYDDDGTFLGFVAAFRGEQDSFTRKDQQMMNRLADQVGHALRLAWAADRVEEPTAMHLVVDERGRVIYASRFASDWLTRRRQRLIRRLVRRSKFAVVDGVRFDIRPMAQNGSCFLAGKPVPGYRVSSANLSEIQKSVVRLVEAGLSNEEIGEQLTMSPSTVKYHLRIVFEQLEVSSRIEVVRSGATNL